jgi:hypothetical protein
MMKKKNRKRKKNHIEHYNPWEKENTNKGGVQPATFPENANRAKPCAG